MAATPAVDIANVESELAEAVSAAVARRRAGQPATEEMRVIETLSKRRKRLYLRHTSAFS